MIVAMIMDTPMAEVTLTLPPIFGMAFGIGIALNVSFVLIEVVYGFLSNSVALLADASHNPVTFPGSLSHGWRACW